MTPSVNKRYDVLIIDFHFSCHRIHEDQTFNHVVLSMPVFRVPQSGNFSPVIVSQWIAINRAVLIFEIKFMEREAVLRLPYLPSDPVKTRLWSFTQSHSRFMTHENITKPN